MKTEYLLAFIIAFIAPILYQRGRFALRPNDFYDTWLRDLLKRQIHHAHWGIGWILIAIILIVAAQILNSWTMSILGLGLGLLIDEIFPSLNMPGDNRELELKVYADSLENTILLAIAFLVTFTTICALFAT